MDLFTRGPGRGNFYFHHLLFFHKWSRRSGDNFQIVFDAEPAI